MERDGEREREREREKEKAEQEKSAAAPARSHHPHPPTLPPFSPRSPLQGERASTDFRIFMESAKTPGTPISTWHDIPLANPDGTLNFVCEIPAESSAKMEVCTKEAANPIKQDIKKGNLRFYPYNINWNYGMLPQTWEDPKVVHPELEVAVSGWTERPFSLFLFFSFPTLPPLSSLSLSLLPPRVTRACLSHTQFQKKRLW